MCFAPFLLAAKKPVEKKAPVDAHQEVYFSPSGHTQERILFEILNSKTSIDLALYTFTSRSFESALKKAHKRGVQIRLVADAENANDKSSVVRFLAKEGLAVKLIRGEGRRGIMHHKFAIFDRQLLLTGSYNWSYSAENYNYENSLFLRDRDLISAYEKAFNSLWAST